MKTIDIGHVRIPFDDYLTQGTALLGIRGAGKTYTAKGIAEQMLDHSVPIIVFDAIGVWRFLKVAADKNGKAYKVVVAGGEQPDLPLTPHSAPQIIRAAIKENIPLVVDLYDTKLSKSDWRKIVQESFRILLYENQGLRHIFLEEAAEYVPQKINDGAVYAEVEKLVRMGGNKSLGITMINQRSQELNKAVLELCDNLVMMRQKGFNAIAYAEKWADRLSPSTAKEIGEKLPKMVAGECWVFTDSQEEPVFTRSHPIKSFHPDRKQPQHPKNSAVADPTDFVNRLALELPKIIEEQKANDPAELKRQVAALQRKVVELERNGPEVKQSAPIEVPVITKEERELINRAAACFEFAREAMDSQMAEVRKVYQELNTLSGKVGVLMANGTRTLHSRIVLQPKSDFAKPSAERTVRTSMPRRTQENGSLTGGERAIMTALAQYPEGCTREQLSVLTGYKRSSRDTFIQRLTSNGYAQADSNSVYATTDGIAALGSYEPLPIGPALIEYWRYKLSGGELALFNVAVDKYPHVVDRESLSTETGYQRSSRDTFIQRLSARKLITTTREGITAAKQLFE